MKEVLCAIYTRKSSEEGLEQSFNSLDAQREACEAYILSQKHEGWHALSAKYDDGGFSGGNMERPGLKRLLEGISAGKVNTVVVYKVDRLTRSLGDFARIVESFDSKGVSFVSVTQQFNTTTSMGRLTLNVLLSFAQFEREVTGERIRDKVAASKRKGMWMGGIVPLGYDIKDHQLVVNVAEAEQVREIFQQYLRLGSVFDLQEHLQTTTIRSKRRTSAAGKSWGDAIMCRGTLYHLLKSPLYIGKIAHKGQIYPGLHKAIISPDIWKRTSEMLQGNGVKRVTSRNLPSGRLLTGLLLDVDGNLFTPSHASKKGRRYDYYISKAAVDRKHSRHMKRLPALETEQLVVKTIRSLLINPLELSERFPHLTIREMRLLAAAAQHRAEQLSDPSSAQAKQFLRTVLRSVTFAEKEIRISLDHQALEQQLVGRLSILIDWAAGLPELIEITASFEIKRRGSEVRLVLSSSTPTESAPILSLVRCIARAHEWSGQIICGKARTLNDLCDATGLERHYVRRVMQSAALSPKLAETILNGQQPPDLTVVRLTGRLPLDWQSQCLR